MALAELAAKQHWVVAMFQLRELGFSSEAVRHRIRAGRLHPVHRGVYAFGRRSLTRKGKWMAAVLACGPDAVLSHCSAAALLGLREDNRAVTDVTVSRRTRHQREGIDLHSGATLQRADITTIDGIPCTTVARTLLDLADVLDRRGVEKACERAEILRIFDGRQVDDVLARANGRRGAPILGAILADLTETATRSEVEERFLAICETAGVPTPLVNQWLDLPGDAIRPDFMWPRERLIVETDGRETHGTRQAFERDRKRDRRLVLAGWRVVRFTWRQVTSEPDEVIRTLLSLLEPNPAPRTQVNASTAPARAEIASSRAATSS